MPPASIAGQVFADANDDGIRQPGEPGIAGQTITLTGVDAFGNPVNRTVETDANGSWRFDNLPPGNYTVTQPTQPPNTSNGKPVAGSAGGTAGNPTAGSSTIAGISLAPGANSTGNSFAEVAAAASLSGKVWLDANNNGLVDGGEAGLAGVAITVSGTDASGAAVSRSTTTDANGDWRVDGLLPGSYTVSEPTQPANTLNGRTVAGTAGGTPTAAATTPSSIGAITLAAGQSGSGNHFGEVPPASIAGRVFADANNDGIRQPGEAGIAGQTITLSGTDAFGNPVSRTTTTDADGNWRFDNLAPGNYTVTQPNQPAGTQNGRTLAGSAGGTGANPPGGGSTISAIALSPGASSTDNNFGELPATAALSGRVWLDANNDGVLDATESGIAGVAIDLVGTDITGQTVTRSTLTDASGAWRFDGLPPGSYSVSEPTQPAGTLNGRTVSTAAGASVTAPTVAASAIGGVVLAAGQTSTGHGFAEIPPAEISGRVFGDSNNNGSVDAGEAGLPGVALTLAGTDDLGQTVSASVQTQADGSWRVDSM